MAQPSGHHVARHARLYCPVTLRVYCVASAQLRGVRLHATLRTASHPCSACLRTKLHLAGVSRCFLRRCTRRTGSVAFIFGCGGATRPQVGRLTTALGVQESRRRWPFSTSGGKVKQIECMPALCLVSHTCPFSRLRVRGRAFGGGPQANRPCTRQGLVPINMEMQSGGE